MAKVSMKKVKAPYKQETYQPIVKGKAGKLTKKSAVKLKSDRMKGYK